ncbi:MAG: AmmeMemoRadiSam system radical SAM enzyme [Bacteroidales bacterium]|jgi:pyruvate formate lyase activating enzyme
MQQTQYSGNETKSLTKRDFLKKSFLGICGMAAGMYCFPLLANPNKKEVKANNAMNESIDLEYLLKHSTEASYYSQEDDNYIKCHLCPNGCYLAENGRSKCRNKFNVKGKLYTIAYSDPCIIHTDPIEKKPLFHFYPETNVYSMATAGCNLRCLNCQNWTISQVGPEEADNFDLKPADIVKACSDAGTKAIAFTYSEPIAFYEYMLEIAKLAKAKGIKTVVVSNGYINETPLKELCKYVSAASINLKNFKNSIYHDLNGGALQPVMNALKTYKENGVWLEIINLIVPTWTDDMDMIKEMCDWLASSGFADTPLHFSRFTPMYKLTNLPYTPVATLEKAMTIANKSGLKYVYVGNVPGHNAENTFCPACSKKVIGRKGFVVTEKHIKKGKCEYCGNTITGIWE